MNGVLSEIIGLLTSGIVPMAEGIGAGLTALVSSIFLDTTGETAVLSTFGGIIAIFGGVALAIGLSKAVVKFCTSFGSSRL